MSSMPKRGHVGEGRSCTIEALCLASLISGGGQVSARPSRALEVVYLATPMRGSDSVSREGVAGMKKRAEKTFQLSTFQARRRSSSSPEPPWRPGRRPLVVGWILAAVVDLRVPSPRKRDGVPEEDALPEASSWGSPKLSTTAPLSRKDTEKQETTPVR